ncbi:hypothetical protein HG535_0D04560 [Zygotorulaspora mrakii]|uniref:NADP-dependent oxidoreductase domain-containing protein n=1 Tax=Zygotorulaspora mrakii TaxID=42260 RepID=A0A7H9B2N2_ZYGMR|nr:uncharacterized protein HG535_0D04560 [Zygotorulaspora mrakii]QLG72747.1 hypothetical protein HG535_0D04560 [Zygotorulaspora mrakii]
MSLASKGIKMAEVSKFKRLSNHVSIPSIGLGVYQVDNKTAERVVYQALKVGYRHFDSAQLYRNEAGVSNGIEKWLDDVPNSKRQDVFYTTKIADVSHGYEKTKKSLEKSLKTAAGLDYIDLVLVHSPQSNTEKRLSTWKALQEFVESGRVKSIGVSNYGVRHLKELLEWEGLKTRPVINQVEINPWLLRKDLVDFCHHNDIQVEAYSPLTRGRKLGDATVKRLAEKYKKDPGQILLRWSLQLQFIVIPKTVHQDRLISNFDVYDFEITDDDMALLTHPDDYGVIAGWDPVKYQG